ncbi:hypothetical protein [Sphingopyxis macrogoltabida]|uniref:Uncharacterized protein n=1 Tax=Sphingopyxis macrogoltabida TaxID=33050 RepID=A0A0N9V814_SPHMC|nr:hypothetical protein [Sphingopyxis macrogoltabida]ALH80390.1 hypothetical protein AN936_08420 [Sphingopyxis macrogoltabida]
MTTALLDMFTATPQLSAADRRDARKVGLRMASSRSSSPAQRALTATAAERAFANRSHDHMGVAIFMRGSTREEIKELHAAMRAGTNGQLDRPLAYVATTLRKLNWNERREAWRLFGQGLIL